MPRVQEFDTDTVVARARDLFWDKGFEATSVPDLERVTGLNRSSLYNAFGSKRVSSMPPCRTTWTAWSARDCGS